MTATEVTWPGLRTSKTVMPSHTTRPHVIKQGPGAPWSAMEVLNRVTRRSASLPRPRAVRDGTQSNRGQRPLRFHAHGCRAEPDSPRDERQRSRSHRRRHDEVGTPRRRAGRLGMQATQFLAEPDPWGSRARGNGGAGRRSRRQEEGPDTRAREATILPGAARGMRSFPPLTPSERPGKPRWVSDPAAVGFRTNTHIQRLKPTLCRGTAVPSEDPVDSNTGGVQAKGLRSAMIGGTLNW